MTGIFDDHLSLDAVVAFADGEMSLTAYQRAATHVMRCELCAAEVAEQTAASQYIRQAGLPTMPGSLFDALKSIPVALPQAGPVTGVIVDSTSGQSIRVSGDIVGHTRGRRFRLGAGALVAGIAVGAAVVAAAGERPATQPRPLPPETAAVGRPPVGPGTTVINVLARRVDVLARTSSTR